LLVFLNFAHFALATAPCCGKHGAAKTTLSTQTCGSGYDAIMVDYFTKAAELEFFLLTSSHDCSSRLSQVMADALWDSFLATSDNGSEFAGAFRHQLERFGFEHVTTSAYHPQSNGAAERLVATVKSILAAKVAGAVHDWPALLPQIRMEYM
jgi:transposase InsO family protein